MKRYLAVPVLFLLLAGDCFGAEITVGNFASGDMTGWKPKIFKGETLYSFVRDGKRTVLKAYSKNAASGLFKKVKVDSAEYPVLRWSWKIDRLLEREDAASKQGDDFAARVYVVFPGTLFWRTRAIVYVWSGKLAKGSALRNPYTGNAIVIAVESGHERIGTWVHEERNYHEDYRRFFGEEPPRLGAVAVMTDTDNTGGEAVAWYGNISLAGGRSPASP